MIEFPISISKNENGRYKIKSYLNDEILYKNLNLGDCLVKYKQGIITQGYIKDLISKKKEIKLKMFIDNFQVDSIENQDEIDLKNKLYFPRTMNCPHIKYYRDRFQLFSLYDKGIRLDSQSWYSVTPEVIF